MHRWYRIAALFACIALLCFAFGCSDDDDSPTGTNNTTPLDLQYDIFSGEFGGASEMTGEMISAVFYHLDLITAPVSPGKELPRKAAYGMIYHDNSKFWVVYDTVLVDETITMVDSIQFIQGSDTVQYPNTDSLTEVRSLMTMTMSTAAVTKIAGTAVDLATFHQNISITTTETPSDTVFASGTGSVSGSVMDTMQDMSDSIVCDVNLDATWTINAFSIDMSNYEGGSLPCPFAGSAVYNVDADIVCDGTESGSTIGNWVVTLTFDDGLMAWAYTFSGRTWYDTSSCMD